MSKLFLRISIPALAAILALGQYSFAGPKPPPPPPKPPIIFPPIIFPPKPPVILPPPVVIVPPPVIVVPPAPLIVVVTPPAPPVIAADDPLLAGNAAAAMQTKKYLQITNNTGSRLQVFALYLGEDDKGQGMWLPAADKDGANQPITASLDPGQTYTLATNDSAKVLTSRVRVWAKTDTKQWLTYQSEDLVLVDKPYQAEKPGTFPMQFGQ